MSRRADSAISRAPTSGHTAPPPRCVDGDGVLASAAAALGRDVLVTPQHARARARARAQNRQANDRKGKKEKSSGRGRQRGLEDLRRVLQPCTSRSSLCTLSASCILQSRSMAAGDSRAKARARQWRHGQVSGRARLSFFFLGAVRLVVVVVAGWSQLGYAGGERRRRAGAGSPRVR